MVLENIPRTYEENLLREQSIGEIRGLRRLEKALLARIAEIRQEQADSNPPIQQ